MKLIPARLAAIGYSHGKVDTVLIANGRGKGPLLINASDFDEEKHKLFKGEDPRQAEPKTSDPVELLVMKSTKGDTKGKFVIANTKGEAITGDDAEALGIDEAGYATEAEATAVIAG